MTDRPGNLSAAPMDGTTPSTSPENAGPAENEEVYDVVVAGAGIAGATAARLFAARGLKVLLAERETFPRYKVCGSCLNLRALSFLSSAGREHALDAEGAIPTRGLQLATSARSAHVPLPGGVAISRARLDSYLVRAATEKGVHFLQNSTVKAGPVDGPFRMVTIQTGGADRTLATRLLLAAGGLQGAQIDRLGAAEIVVAPQSRIGVGAILPEAPARFVAGQMYMACGGQGYAGLVRVEDGQLAIAAALDRDYVRDAGGPGKAVEELLCSSTLPETPDLSTIQWKGTPPLTRHASRLSAERILVLGDAGGYVEPFTGEGMAWAFASAHTADTLINGRLDQAWEPLAAQWEQTRRRAMKRQRLFCRLMARVLRSPRTTEAMVALLASSSHLSSPFVRLMNANSRS